MNLQDRTEQDVPQLHPATMSRSSTSTTLSSPINIVSAVSSAPSSGLSTSLSSRRSSFTQIRARNQPYFPQESWLDGACSPHTYLSSSPTLREYMTEMTIAERSPSPHTRPLPGSGMADATQSSKSPGLIRRLSRGAQNKLRRRASTTHSMRMRDQSAGPVLMRRRSDSVENSEPGQDVSDLDLDNVTDDLNDDIPEVPLLPTVSRDPSGLGINIGRPSASSSRANTFEGGIAPASSAVLENGTWVYKMTKRQRKRVKLWLDPNTARVCWHSTKTGKSFFIDDVREYRVGAQSRNARDDVAIPQEQEDLWITIVYDTAERSQGRSIKTMHVLMPDNFLLKLWTDALDTVTRQRVGVMSTLSWSVEKHEKGVALAWQQALSRAGRARDPHFTLDDARWFCRMLEINCSENTVRTYFTNADHDHAGHLDFEKFCSFVKSFRERGDVHRIYGNLEYLLDLEGFFRFLTTMQGVDVQKDISYWTSIFEKYVRSVQPRGVQNDDSHMVLTPQGLQNFLASPHNTPLVPKINDPPLDRPLNEYYISSSHNTYLLGRQVRGTSSVEGYIAALVKGCRCVEIDCWDGDDGRPMVTHGRTMTTKIPFEDCVSVVAKYAFNSSPYPLIISLEVHCNPEQQLVMVELMKKYFKEMMVTEPLSPNSTSLPSPQELRNRILIKVKASTIDELEPAILTDSSNGRSRSRSLNSSIARAPSTSAECHSALSSPAVASSTATSPCDSFPSFTPRGSSVTSGPTVTPISSADDSDEVPMSADKLRKRKTSRIVPELGRLGVYMSGIKFHSFQDPGAKSYNHIFSVAENVFDKLRVRKTDDKALLERHNVKHLMRVYPSNMRVDSSNFNPLQCWRRGVQMAALNWQNYDTHQQVNEAMFAAGADRSGYVLKPEELRNARHLPTADALLDPSGSKEKKGRKLVRFSVDIISARRLPRPRTQSSDATMNTHIEFEVFSVEDRARGNGGDGSSDAAPRDGTGATYSPMRKRSRLITANGFDPQYNSTISMAVETKFPSLVFVRFTVWNTPEGKSSSTASLLATFTAKLDSLQQGYRLLPLFNPHGEQYRDATLFVQIVKDAPVLLRREEYAADSADIPASPRPELARTNRFWPPRMFSRTPSQRKRERPYAAETASTLTRVSSADRPGANAVAI